MPLSGWGNWWGQDHLSGRNNEGRMKRKTKEMAQRWHKFQSKEESLKMKQVRWGMMQVSVEECVENEGGIDSKLYHHNLTNNEKRNNFNFSYEE